MILRERERERDFHLKRKGKIGNKQKFKGFFFWLVNIMFSSNREVSIVHFENPWRFVYDFKQGSGQYNFNKS